jgi:methylglyoxal synthase
MTRTRKAAKMNFVVFAQQENKDLKVVAEDLGSTKDCLKWLTENAKADKTYFTGTIGQEITAKEEIQRKVILSGPAKSTKATAGNSSPPTEDLPPKGK